jgi:fatty acid desaturase
MVSALFAILAVVVILAILAAVAFGAGLLVWSIVGVLVGAMGFFIDEDKLPPWGHPPGDPGS